jgi:hypothetical protein
MKKQPTTFKRGARSRFFKATFHLGLLPACLLLLTVQPSQAGSATWKASPATGDWNTATNWTVGGPPNGPSDTATFATSNKTAVSLSSITQVNGIVFNSGASAFTLTGSSGKYFYIGGAGITNNSGITQQFVAAGDASGNAVGIDFANSATAGSATSFTIMGGAGSGVMYFNNSSTAGSGSFTLNGPSPSGAGFGSLFFLISATAGNGSFTINGSALSGYGGGLIYFADHLHRRQWYLHYQWRRGQRRVWRRHAIRRDLDRQQCHADR